MSEFLENAKVVLIEKIENHPNADRLDIAYVNSNYPVIVKRDEYKVGDKCSYIPVDSVVPDTSDFYFLVNNKDKYPPGSVPESKRMIKAKKIRDVFSMGLIFPCPNGFNVGDSIIEHFGLTKMIEEEEENIPQVNGKPNTKGQDKKKPKTWDSPHYDIDSLRKFYNLLVELNQQVTISEKLNGCNASYTHDSVELWVKSRNFFKKSNEEKQKEINKKLIEEGREPITIDGNEDQWWDIAVRFNLSEKLAKYPMMTFFGECYGQVGKFPYDKRPGEYSRIRFFDIYSQTEHRYLNHDEFIHIMNDLELDYAPVLYTGDLPTFEELEKLADGMTLLGGKNIREGIVVKTLTENKIGHHRAQFKLISKTYLLSK
jgi:RNA ligase (TIGR02306 family)